MAGDDGLHQVWSFSLSQNAIDKQRIQMNGTITAARPRRVVRSSSELLHSAAAAGSVLRPAKTPAPGSAYSYARPATTRLTVCRSGCTKITARARTSAPCSGCFCTSPPPLATRCRDGEHGGHFAHPSTLAPSAFSHAPPAHASDGSCSGPCLMAGRPRRGIRLVMEHAADHRRATAVCRQSASDKDTPTSCS